MRKSKFIIVISKTGVNMELLRTYFGKKFMLRHIDQYNKKEVAAYIQKRKNYVVFYNMDNNEKINNARIELLNFIENEKKIKVWEMFEKEEFGIKALTIKRGLSDQYKEKL